MKNKELLDEFVAYCEENPELRFWQALRSWSGQSFLLAADTTDFTKKPPYLGLKDTFYWEFKDK